VKKVGIREQRTKTVWSTVASIQGYLRAEVTYQYATTSESRLR